MSRYTIEYCPHRTITTRKKTNDGGWVEIKDFMKCIGDECPYYQLKETGDFDMEVYEECARNRYVNKWRGDEF